MPIETSVTHIADLEPLYPFGTDNRLQGDNHIRNIKTALKNDLPLTTPATATGIALLTAANAAAARTALGSTATGDALFITSTATAARTTLDVYSKAEVYTKSETDTKLDNPAFSAYIAANQTITSSTYTKCNFDTEEFDIGSCYDTTLKRWTPNKAGYYFVLETVNNISTTTPSIFVCSIYKNGTSYKQTGDIRNGVIGSITASALVYMNGTTDYLECYAYIAAAAPLISGSSNASSFSGYFVRS
jgi:hypothetical protein